MILVNRSIISHQIHMLYIHIIDVTSHICYNVTTTYISLHGNMRLLCHIPWYVEVSQESYWEGQGRLKANVACNTTTTIYRRLGYSQMSIDNGHGHSRWLAAVIHRWHHRLYWPRPRCIGQTYKGMGAG